MQRKALTESRTRSIGNYSASHGAPQSNPVPFRVLQAQIGNRAVASMVQRQIAETACSPRNRDEVSQSRSSGFVGSDVSLTGNVLTIRDFGVGRANTPDGIARREGWQRALSYISGDPNMRVSLEGYSDCHGDAQPNLRLRRRRAEAVEALFPDVVRSRVAFNYSINPYSYLAPNATPQDRARNRAVKVTFLPMRNGGGSRSAAPQFTRATNLDEYIYLVREAERRLGLTSTSAAPQFVSALRQIYYGSAAWSLSQNSAWDQVVTTRPWSPGVDPAPLLGQYLHAALRSSKVVEGVDMGHVFTGIDSMRDPGHVDVNIGRRFTLGTGVEREAWATWAGDVGSVSAKWLISEVDGSGNTKTIDDFFDEHASPEDLQGDIDAFAIRASHNLRSNPTDSLMSQLRLNAPLSEVLLRYYRLTSRTEGVSRSSARRDFVRAYGGVFRGQQLTNRAAVHAALNAQADEFARLFYTKRGVLVYGDPALAAFHQLPALTEYATWRFLNWLLSATVA